MKENEQIRANKTVATPLIGLGVNTAPKNRPIVQTVITIERIN